MNEYVKTTFISRQTGRNGNICYTIDKNVYRENNLKEILETLDRNAYSFYDYVMEHENALFVDYLYEILDTMFDSVERGLKREGTIPGKLQLPRVAKQMYTQAINLQIGRASCRERV